MSWAKLDDRFLMNPKIMSAGLEGRALYVAGILYCAGELTDGNIPKAAVRKLSVLSDVEDTAAAVLRLVELGLWREDPETGGFVVHDYLDYNPSASAVKEGRAEVSQKRATAGRQGAVTRWQKKAPATSEKTTTAAKNGNKPATVHSKPIANDSKRDGKTEVANGKPIAKECQTHGKVIANAWQNDSKTDGKTMAPSPSPSPLIYASPITYGQESPRETLENPTEAIAADQEFSEVEIGNSEKEPDTALVDTPFVDDVPVRDLAPPGNPNPTSSPNPPSSPGLNNNPGLSLLAGAIGEVMAEAQRFRPPPWPGPPMPTRRQGIRQGQGPWPGKGARP